MLRAMPPRPPKPPPSRPHHRRAPAQGLSGFVDERAIDAVLAPFVPSAPARAFVLRALLREGPAHHRGANFVLLRLLGLVAERLGATGVSGEVLPFAMRLPPHLEGDADDATWPLGVPARALARLATPGSREHETMFDCVTDGPPQHAVANVAMLTLLEAVLERLEAREAREPAATGSREGEAARGERVERE
jgi:hypothetical protein